MEVHHLVGQQEEHIKSKCLYCNTSFDAKNWHSYHHGETHYKVIRCSCGKTLSVKVGFHGSGHDSWHKRDVVSDKNVKGNNIGNASNIKNIEDRIQKAETDEEFRKAEEEMTKAIERNVETPFNVLVGSFVRKFRNIESSKVMRICNNAAKQKTQKKD